MIDTCFKGFLGLVHVVIPATITTKPTKIYEVYVTMAVLRNRCDLIGATHIPVAPYLIYKDSPDPIPLGSGTVRLMARALSIIIAPYSCGSKCTYLATHALG